MLEPVVLEPVVPEPVVLEPVVPEPVVLVEADVEPEEGVVVVVLEPPVEVPEFVPEVEVPVVVDVVGLLKASATLLINDPSSLAYCHVMTPAFHPVFVVDLYFFTKAAKLAAVMVPVL